MLSLKSTLLLNGVSSWFTGVALIVFANKVVEFFGAGTVWPFIGTGAFFVVFGTLVLYTVLQKHIKPELVKIITVLDILWVVVSIGMITGTWGSISVAGSLIIIAVAVWVSTMAFLQSRGLKLLRLSRAAITLMAGVMLSLSITSSSAQNISASGAGHEQAIKVVEHFLEAVEQKNAVNLAAAMDSLIVWKQPGNNCFSGIKNNAKEVFAMFGGMLKMTNRTLTLTEKKILAQHGNQVVCQLQWKAVQPGGASLFVSNIDVYTVENGKITQAVVYSANNKLEDEFWGK